MSRPSPPFARWMARASLLRFRKCATAHSVPGKKNAVIGKWRILDREREGSQATTSDFVKGWTCRTCVVADANQGEQLDLPAFRCRRQSSYGRMPFTRSGSE